MLSLRFPSDVSQAEASLLPATNYAMCDGPRNLTPSIIQLSRTAAYSSPIDLCPCPDINLQMTKSDKTSTSSHLSYCKRLSNEQDLAESGNRQDDQNQPHGRVQVKFDSKPSRSTLTPSPVTNSTTSSRNCSNSPKSTTSSALFSPSPRPRDQPDMSKLSEGLKALISAPHARPGYTRAPSNIRSVFNQIAQDAQSKKVGLPAWVTISTAASMTLNCPEAMTQIFNLTTETNQSQSTSTSTSTLNPVTTAELMREVGLKCISFNGIPRAINCLGAFHSSLPKEIREQLSTKPTREYTASNIDELKKGGLALWDDVYRPFERKLLDKLAQSHPDLPVHIINGHYSNLLADPPTSIKGAKVGRVLTSLIAITCLRAQTGVGPQVTSHVFGLRKAYESGAANAEGEERVEGGEWLASEQGNRWILESIDGIVHAITTGEGTTFAPGLRAKL